MRHSRRTSTNASIPRGAGSSGSDGVDIGELLREERPDELVLVRLAVVPEWQGRGISSAIVRPLLERGRELESALSLQIFRVLRAARLYESLGFLRVGETDTDVVMRA